MSRSRFQGPTVDAYWKRFGEVFHVLKKELQRQQLFRGNDFQNRHQAVSVAAGLADALCESEGLDPWVLDESG